MKVLLYDHPDHVDVAELQRDLLLLPDWRKEKVLAYRHLVDRVQCAKAYILLCQCLAEEYGISDMPYFEYGKYGKPMLSSRDALPLASPSLSIHFNLSHCSKGVMCVVDDVAVGCDIEEIPRELDSCLLSACFSQAEQEYILCAAHPCMAFAKLWTRKEALLKLEGIGLVDDLPLLLSSSLARGVEFTTKVFESKGYVYTIAKRK